MSVTRIASIDDWAGTLPAPERERLHELLEQGQVLWFENLAFPLSAEESELLTPTVSDGRSKNVSVDPARGSVSGTSLTGAQLDLLRAMVTRFSGQSRTLLESLFPSYSAHLQTRLASYRPVQIEGRASSDCKDDSRLHVDAFASRPSQGQRILRVFCNINPQGQARTWLVGGAFEPYARELLPRVRRPWPFEATLLHRLRVTKQKRTPYDHFMLGLHNSGKLDTDYQARAPRERFDFPPRSTWVCFTDQVQHAALRGHYLLEQTFFLPIEAMAHPERSPLRTLERLAGRSLT